MHSACLPGRAFHYSSAARLTVWSLTLPQVAATLAAALVAFDTFDRAGQRLIDGRLLNVVLVLMLTTAILGPVLTARFAQRMLPERTPEKHCQVRGSQWDVRSLLEAAGLRLSCEDLENAYFNLDHVEPLFLLCNFMLSVVKRQFFCSLRLVVFELSQQPFVCQIERVRVLPVMVSNFR